MPRKKRDIGERLADLVYCDPNSGCHIFCGGEWNGYGQFYIGDKRFLAHRVAWELAGNVIPDSMCVLHKCDQKLCTNVDHLFLGTKGDNNADRARKGRSAKGKNPFGVTPVKLSKDRGFSHQVHVAPPGAGSGGARYFGTYKDLAQAAAVAAFVRSVAYGPAGLASPPAASSGADPWAPAPAEGRA